ncbi:MAG TPA: hypothetical protein PKJ29_11890, partial [Giesbergeria sp.]|nr:hypothetical protein [Giesbergeria sp.]HNN17417.1 hypothetical protein [Giesbergeria sp.]
MEKVFPPESATGHKQPPRARGRRYNRAKKAHGGDRKSEESRAQFEPLKTAELTFRGSADAFARNFRAAF